MHARKLIILALLSLVMGLSGLGRAEDKAAPAPAAAEPKCPHAKTGDCPHRKAGAKTDCPCAKTGDCPCAMAGKECKCPHCQPADVKPDEQTAKPGKKVKKAK